MDLLTGNVKKLYFRYLGAAFGSAIISSIYGLVDTAMVGQYHGPQGAAAMAVVAPVWNIIYSLGLLAGIGGSVLFSTAGRSGNIFPPPCWACPGWLLSAGWSSSYWTPPFSPCSGLTRRCSPWPRPIFFRSSG